MAIGFYEKFTAHDWNKYSVIGGKVSTIACWVSGILNFLLGYSILMGIWTIFVGFLIAIWELPVAYFWFSKIEQFQEFCLEKLKLKYPATRAIIYLCLSISCYTIESPCILAGLLLMISGVLYIFAQINQNEEAHDGTSKLVEAQAQKKNSASDRTSLLNGGNTFGTFV